MMKATFNQDQRFDELIAGYVLGDLGERELEELQSYRTDEIEAAIERTELAAARVMLTFESQSPHLQPMPDELLKRLTTQTWSSFTAKEELRLFGHPNPSSASPERLRSEQPSASMELREMVGWFAAIAATALAIASWIPNWSDRGTATVLRTVSSPQAAVDRAALLASAEDLIRVSWTRPDAPSPSDASRDFGDVVWSSKFQKGYIRIQGLTRNDPTQEQYQLWILDPLRDSKPVDGGVFDIDRDGEVILPIQAKLRVDQPTLFAITVEKPGGVVVSDQSRLPLLAVVANR